MVKTDEELEFVWACQLYYTVIKFFLLKNNLENYVYFPRNKTVSMLVMDLERIKWFQRFLSIIIRIHCLNHRQPIKVVDN
jgi:hypothetical protein